MSPANALAQGSGKEARGEQFGTHYGGLIEGSDGWIDEGGKEGGKTMTRVFSPQVMEGEWLHESDKKNTGRGNVETMVRTNLAHKEVLIFVQHFGIYKVIWRHNIICSPQPFRGERANFIFIWEVKKTKAIRYNEFKVTKLVNSRSGTRIHVSWWIVQCFSITSNW